MYSPLKEILWNQFGASIDMLMNAISNCPEHYFEAQGRFYFIAFHSAVFLDYYLTIPPADFAPKLAFTQKEANDRPEYAIGDLIPDKVYDKKEIVEYINESKEKCRQLIFSLTDEKLNERFKEGSDPNDMDYPLLEILLYNLRHTQHHTAQLNLLLRQDIGLHVQWSFRVDEISKK